MYLRITCNPVADSLGSADHILEPPRYPVQKLKRQSPSETRYS